MSVPQLTTRKWWYVCFKQSALKQSHSEITFSQIEITYRNIRNKVKPGINYCPSPNKSKLTGTAHVVFQRGTRGWDHYCVHAEQDTEPQMTSGTLAQTRSGGSRRHGGKNLCQQKHSNDRSQEKTLPLVTPGGECDPLVVNVHAWWLFFSQPQPN